MKKRITWTIINSIFLALILFSFIYYIKDIINGINQWNTWKEINAEYGTLNRLYEYIANSALMCLTCGFSSFVCIYMLVKQWILSPKERLERDENNRIKVELDRQKERENTLFEIEKKEKEIEKLKSKLN